MGSGRLDDPDRDLFIGKAGPELFQSLCARITPGVTEFLGHRLADARPVGKRCELTVSVKYADGHDASSGWRYGSKSQGPHPAIVEFVKETIRITEPWFQAQKSMVARQPATSPPE